MNQEWQVTLLQMQQTSCRRLLDLLQLSETHYYRITTGDQGRKMAEEAPEIFRQTQLRLFMAKVHTYHAKYYVYFHLIQYFTVPHMNPVDSSGLPVGFQNIY